MVDRNLYAAYRFFRQHAGYVVGENAKGAFALAKAEQWAEDNEMDYTWEYDTWADLGDHEYWCAQERAGQEHDHEVEICRAEYNDEVVASLSGIIDADRNYRRVVEAELALEAMQEAERFAYY